MQGQYLRHGYRHGSAFDAYTALRDMCCIRCGGRLRSIGRPGGPDTTESQGAFSTLLPDAIPREKAKLSGVFLRVQKKAPGTYGKDILSLAP